MAKNYNSGMYNVKGKVVKNSNPQKVKVEGKVIKKSVTKMKPKSK